MKRGAGWIGVLCVIVLMSLPQASAVTHFGASAAGATDAAGACNAAAHILIAPISMGVAYLDYVDIYLNYSYYDNRSTGARAAVHNFNVSAIHNGAGTTSFGGPHTTTGGGTGPPIGTGSIFAHVLITDETNTIAITWNAKVTITPGCNVSTSLTHTITTS